VKTENPGVCATVCWKVCGISSNDTAVLSVVPSCGCIRVNKANQPIRNPLLLVTQTPDT
jgi:hypothetical protein